MGWLSAIPEQESGDGSISRWPNNRLEQIEKEGRTPNFPTGLRGQYLLDMLLEAGPTKHIGQGEEHPLSWSDLHAYACCTGAVQEVWEFELLKELSIEFLQGKIQGKSPLSIEPYLQEEDRWTSSNSAS